MKKKLLVLLCVVVVGTFCACDENTSTVENPTIVESSVADSSDVHTDETINQIEEAETATESSSIDPANMSDEELAEYLDGGDAGSDIFWEEHYGNENN